MNAEQNQNFKIMLAINNLSAAEYFIVH